MENVIKYAWVVIDLNSDRTFATVQPIIYLSQPELRPNQSCDIFHNVFDAKKYIQAFVNTHYDPIKIVA